MSTGNGCAIPMRGKFSTWPKPISITARVALPSIHKNFVKYSCILTSFLIPVWEITITRSETSQNDP
jgi:hypothetical protein